MECGAMLVHRQGDTVETEDDLDLENRILCPDGTCTGIIINGRCTVCERIYESEETSSQE
jgi:hypothetical protein